MDLRSSRSSLCHRLSDGRGEILRAPRERSDAQIGAYRLAAGTDATATARADGSLDGNLAILSVPTLLWVLFLLAWALRGLLHRYAALAEPTMWRVWPGMGSVYFGKYVSCQLRLAPVTNQDDIRWQRVMWDPRLLELRGGEILPVRVGGLPHRAVVELPGGVRLLTAGSLRRRMYSGWYFSPIPADRYPLPMPPSRYIVSALILGTPLALPIDGHLTSHAFGIPFMLAIVFQVWGWFGGLPRAGH